MFCPACAERLPEDSRFCGMCGFRLDSQPEYPAAPAEPEEPILLTKTVRGGSFPGAAGPVAAAPVQHEPIPLDRPVRRGPGAPARAAAPAEAHAPILLDSPKRSARDPEAAPVPSALPRRTRDDPTDPLLQLAPIAAPEPVPQFVPTKGLPHTRTVEMNKVEVQEERHAPRVALAVEVSLSSHHNFYQGLVENISHGGLFVATHNLQPLGTEMDVEFSLPELQRTCHVHCAVQWHREYNEGNPEFVPGMGLQFIALTPSDQRTIEVFLKHRDSLFYDDEL